MNPYTAFAGVALTALLAGCSPHSDLTDVNGESFTSAWVEVGTTQFEGDGETGRVVIPAQDGFAALALRATTAPGVCFQLSSVVDNQGHAVIDGRSAGVFCRDCELRASVAVEAGVFLLPVEPGRFEPQTGVSVRFARVDCLTLTPLKTPLKTPEDRAPLQVAAQPIETVPDLATIDLRFHIAKSSILFGDAARQQELMVHLGQELASAGIVPQLVETHDIDTLPAKIQFHAGDHDALAALMSKMTKAETTVDVAFGGCLLYDDPIFGPPSSVNGFTPRIPGGAGPADAMFLPGLDCFAPSAGPVDVPVHAQARFLAHELGHYLGLYHTVEMDGVTDQLDDTDVDNIMHPHPGQATTVGFSLLQGRMMRMHLGVI